jgi:hypothetical protein
MQIKKHKPERENNTQVKNKIPVRKNTTEKKPETLKYDIHKWTSSTDLSECCDLFNITYYLY